MSAVPQGTGTVHEGDFRKRIGRKRIVQKPIAAKGAVAKKAKAAPEPPVQESTAGQGFSLAMTLEDRTRVGELRAWLSLPSTIAAIHAGLQTMAPVLHYARFLPLEAQGQILFVAEFDGDKEAFVKALAKALNEPLNLLFGNMALKPPLPVGDNVDAFWAFVNAVPDLSMSLFCAYRNKTVRDILRDQPPFPVAPTLPDAKNSAAGNAQLPRVAGGFSLLMTLEDQSKLPELLSRLTEDATKARLDIALDALDYVHYARFLPLFESGALMIITEFDGVMQDYVLDFAAALDHEFSMILAYMKGRPPLPVSAYPSEFWAYVDGNLVPDTGLYAAYPDKTVLDIVELGKLKVVPDKPKVPEATVLRSDVQANLLHSFHGVRGYHYYLSFPDAARGRAFVAMLQADHVTKASDVEALNKNNLASTCCTIGFTHAGLHALEVPEHLLESFPEAFRQGPAQRAAQNGDQGDSDPGKWLVGGLGKREIHAVLSLHARKEADDEAALTTLDALIVEHQVEPLFYQGTHLYGQKAETLKDRPKEVHFGYRDGISQPRIAGIHAERSDTPKPDAEPGDFLLGHDYFNSRGGRYIGKLVEPLARNATYGAFRVIEQDSAAFENLIAKARTDSELLAAKLMGRWRDGTPLTLHGDAPLGAALKTGTPLDNFDYATPANTGDDRLGLRCPIGAHVRRLNPRAGMVLGLPWGRLVLRRGLPYGERYEGNGQPDGKERGLVGMFLCGDLESQFEFLLSVWGRHDLSSFGLRKTQDPFIASGPTTFRFTPKGADQPIEFEVPTLTKTRGSLYLFIPGIEGLGWIGGAKWREGPGGQALKALQKLRALQAPPAAPASAGAPAGALMGAKPAGGGAGLAELDPTLSTFIANPYPTYAAYRKEPVKRVGFKHDSWWVMSHALVTEVCHPDNQLLYLKPGQNRLNIPRPFGIAAKTDDGLFFMDPPRHSTVRPALDEVFRSAISSVLPALRQQADRLLAPMQGRPTLKLVQAYAGRMAAWAFMQAVGIPPGPGNAEQAAVEGWTRAMLDGHDPHVGREKQAALGTSSLALRSYLSALAQEQKLPANGCMAPPATVMAGLHKLSRCPVALNPPLNDDEVVNTASHFALGGYLSTEFLITTGIYNLLDQRDQWERLAHEPGLLPQAVWEMLRFDAPFQMADRWVAQDCTLGGVKLAAGSKLTVVYGAANRDEKVFRDPDKFDITRSYEADKIYGFGHGIHRCIGEPLALAVTMAAVGALVEHFPDARLADKGAWMPDPYFRSLDRVTVALH